jgi:uncharacterized protein YndB with AHSA1/START domain
MNVGANALVRVNHRFPASAEAVFDAWLDPELIGKWMFGPAVRDEQVVRTLIDPRVGGAFSFVVRRQGKEINHLGEYLTIERPHRLVFTWTTADSLPATSRVTIEILSLEKQCELTLTHEIQPEWLDYAARIEESWSKMLNVLEATLSEEAT